MTTRTGMYGINHYLLAFAVLLFTLCVTSASARTVTYLKEYTYQASEIDSKLTSRTIALEQVKRLLLEELGTYLISETAIKDFELTKDQISSLTAGIVMTVILDEKWDGKTYFLKAKITAETDDLVKSLDTFRKDQPQTKDWQEVRQKTEEALKEIEQLKKEIAKGHGETVTQQKYAQAVNELNAIDWFKKGYQLRYVDKNNQEAMKAFDRAISIDPQYAKAYAFKGIIYNEWRQYLNGLKYSEEAIRLDPNLADGFNARGVAHAGLGNYREGIQDFNMAMKLAPSYPHAYANRSWAYFMLKDYPQALDDANKAIALGPKFSLGYYWRGRALAALNKTEDAIKDFDEAIRLDPKFSWSFLMRGYAYLKLNKTEQALEDFKVAARLGHSDAQKYLKEKGMQW